MATEDMIDELVDRGTADWLTASELAWVVQQSTGAATNTEIMVTALAVVRAALEQGLMEVGDVGDGGFVAWPLDIDDTLRRIEQEWRALGRRPDLGEVCWLANTKRGNQRARQNAGG